MESLPLSRDTGLIWVAKAADYEEIQHLANGTILRMHEGPYLQTTGGGLTIKAKGKIGETVSGFKYSPLSLVVDAVKMNIASADKEKIAIITTGDVSIASDVEGAGSKAGTTGISSLSGKQEIASELDAAGENIDIVADEVELSAPVRSVGAVLSIVPVDP